MTPTDSSSQEISPAATASASTGGKLPLDEKKVAFSRGVEKKRRGELGSSVERYGGEVVYTLLNGADYVVVSSIKDPRKRFYSLQTSGHSLSENRILRDHCAHLEADGTVTDPAQLGPQVIDESDLLRLFQGKEPKGRIVASLRPAPVQQQPQVPAAGSSVAGQQIAESSSAAQARLNEMRQGVKLAPRGPQWTKHRSKRLTTSVSASPAPGTPGSAKNPLQLLEFSPEPSTPPPSLSSVLPLKRAFHGRSISPPPPKTAPASSQGPRLPEVEREPVVYAHKVFDRAKTERLASIKRRPRKTISVPDLRGAGNQDEARRGEW